MCALLSEWQPAASQPEHVLCSTHLSRVSTRRVLTERSRSLRPDGICQFEPAVEIFEAGKDKVTYVKMTAEKAAEVVEKHLKGGKVVTEYTINGFKA